MSATVSIRQSPRPLSSAVLDTFLIHYHFGASDHIVEIKRAISFATQASIVLSPQSI
jgi:hypothetical protein